MSHGHRKPRACLRSALDARAQCGFHGSVPRPTYREDAATRAEREETLAAVVARHADVNAKMQSVYGMRLPRHLAYAAGFWLALSRAEREEAAAYVGAGLVGVGAWFQEGALARPVKKGLDERLDHRSRRDPPEAVPVFGGTAEGGHWSLFYDDPAELPTVVVNDFAREGGETTAHEATLLESLRDGVVEATKSPDADEQPHLDAILAWLDTVLPREREAHRAEKVAPPPARTRWLLGGMDPVVPGWSLPEDLVGLAIQRKRAAAYRAKDASVRASIERAVSELDAGQPGRALFVGRELHFVDADEWRAECTDLLVRAYEALGRRALADVVRAHHAHREISNVSVYEASASPLRAAVARGDAAEVTRLLASSAAPLAPRDLADTLTSASAIDVIDALLERDPDGAAAGEAVHAWIEEIPVTTSDSESHRLLRARVTHIFARKGARGRGFDAALRLAADVAADVIDAAAKHADLAWRDPKTGVSALHLAARAGKPEVVRAMLDRGAEATARDASGKTAYDWARDAWQTAPREAAAIFELLEARGGGPAKAAAAPPAEWNPGDLVEHVKFGEGVVTAVGTGTGDDTKLTIKFGADSKTLLARFVKRRAAPSPA